MEYVNDLTDDMMTSINMTPLIDVMLVLLIVFMVTLPVIHHAVRIQLPRASSSAEPAQPKPVDLEVQRDGTVTWNSVALDGTTLDAKLAEAAAEPDPPALELYADRDVRYEPIAQVLSATQRAGLTKIHFVTEPKAK